MRVRDVSSLQKFAPASLYSLCMQGMSNESATRKQPSGNCSIDQGRLGWSCWQPTQVRTSSKLTYWLPWSMSWAIATSPTTPAGLALWLASWSISTKFVSDIAIVCLCCLLRLMDFSALCPTACCHSGSHSATHRLTATTRWMWTLPCHQRSMQQMSCSAIAQPKCMHCTRCAGWLFARVDAARASAYGPGGGQRSGTLHLSAWPGSQSTLLCRHLPAPGAALA